MNNASWAHIIDYIKPKQRVLDCGCGKGNLLKQLNEAKNITGYGIDIESQNIVECLKKGLAVYHGDIKEGLSSLPDKSFDVVILSSTLQQVQDPVAIINEMTRVANLAIVTFPNFAYWKCRLSLIQGAIPQTEALPFAWYNTPNIRVISIKSFKQLCKKEGITILKQTNFVNNKVSNTFGFSNSLAEHSLFVIQK